MGEVAVSRHDAGSRGVYRAQVPGSDVPAELTWRARGDGVRVADHTFTPPQARGKGIAGALVQALVADAREQGFKVVPTCPYVAAQFDRHPDWADLRA